MRETNRKRRTTMAAIAVSFLLPAAAPLCAADEGELGGALCATLVRLLPELAVATPEGARAQLVMAIAEQFDYDATRLRTVRMQIDPATAATCAGEREALLGIVNTGSLAAALD